MEMLLILINIVYYILLVLDRVSYVIYVALAIDPLWGDALIHVWNQMAAGRLPWYLAEHAELLDGLRWLFEAGWFDRHLRSAVSETEVKERTDSRLYYQES